MGEHREKLVFPFVCFVALMQEISNLVLTSTGAKRGAHTGTERVERDGTLEDRDIAKHLERISSREPFPTRHDNHGQIGPWRLRLDNHLQIGEDRCRQELACN